MNPRALIGLTLFVIAGIVALTPRRPRTAPAQRQETGDIIRHSPPRKVREPTDNATGAAIRATDSATGGALTGVGEAIIRGFKSLGIKAAEPGEDKRPPPTEFLPGVPAVGHPDINFRIDDSPPDSIITEPDYFREPLTDQTSIPSGDAAFTNQYTSKYDILIKHYAAQENVPPAIIKQQLIAESSLRPDAVGRQGEQGLAQAMPATWKEFMGNRDPFNAENSIEFAARYMAWLLRQTGNNLRGALQSYNGGIGNYQKGRISNMAQGYADKIINRAGIAL